MQAADFRNLDHMTERRKLDGSADGRIFFERQMRTASFVVFEIILQDPAQPGLMTVWDRPSGKRTLAITLEQLRSYACAATVAGRVN